MAKTLAFPARRGAKASALATMAGVRGRTAFAAVLCVRVIIAASNQPTFPIGNNVG
jgi:hypothetical protein